MRRYFFVSEDGEMLLISEQMKLKGFVRVPRAVFMRIAKDRFPWAVVRGDAIYVATRPKEGKQ